MMFMPMNINSIIIIITLEGIEKIKTIKKRESEEYFFHQGCSLLRSRLSGCPPKERCVTSRKTAAKETTRAVTETENTVMASRI